MALGVFLVAAVVIEHARRAPRARAPRRPSGGAREADLTAEMARLLLGGAELEDSLRAVGQRIAAAFDLPSVSIELAWADWTSAGARCR